MSHLSSLPSHKSREELKRRKRRKNFLKKVRRKAVRRAFERIAIALYGDGAC